MESDKKTSLMLMLTLTLIWYSSQHRRPLLTSQRDVLYRVAWNYIAYCLLLSEYRYEGEGRLVVLELSDCDVIWRARVWIWMKLIGSMIERREWVGMGWDGLA